MQPFLSSCLTDLHHHQRHCRITQYMCGLPDKKIASPRNRPMISRGKPWFCLPLLTSRSASLPSTALWVALPLLPPSRTQRTTKNSRKWAGAPMRFFRCLLRLGAQPKSGQPRSVVRQPREVVKDLRVVWPATIFSCFGSRPSVWCFLPFSGCPVGRVIMDNITMTWCDEKPFHFNHYSCFFARTEKWHIFFLSVFGKLGTWNNCALSLILYTWPVTSAIFDMFDGNGLYCILQLLL